MKKIFRLILILIIFWNIVQINIFSQEKTKKYNKIIPLTLNGDEMLLSLITDKSRLAALSGKIKKGKCPDELYNKTLKFEKVENNVELVIDLEPDLVLIMDWMGKDKISQLEDAGIDTFVYKTSRTYEEQHKLFRELAELVDEQEQGKKILKDMDKRLEKLQKQIKEKLKDKASPRILLYSSIEETEGIGTLYDDMIKLIYGQNLAAELGLKGTGKISKEKVIDINPEIILIPVWGMHEKKGTDKLLDILLKDKSFEEVKAVKEKKVYIVAHKYQTITSQYLIDAIEMLGKEVYQLED
ncbi:MULTISPECIES: ABC transporter substrate-binding protein [Fusobacterium]|uniref:ABC transporter substrate-binding protein n=1 Tax=Fusobacterium TaxID=848 RepID=UPI0008A21017|nr:MULTISPECIES: ABC transporter substrate-binding protein [Fusobacterium]OFL89773.1 hypothetical protein HMPREF2747_01550 [Fusobacterium sp. HMSC073F01]